MANPIYQVNDEIDNRYVVQEFLGTGNFSYVYKVLDTLHGDVVALKIFKEVSDVLDRIREEFNILKNLSHPHIARVYDIGVLGDNSYFLKLEYIEGNVLQDLINQRRISLIKARTLIKDLLDAISFLHSNKVMHRDLKPNNLITNGRGLVIVDFNISKLVESYATTKVGTPRYMPPEVNIKGWNWTGDLYSTGVILYEMATGKYPFTNGSPLTGENPLDPREHNPAISVSLANAILKAISYDPNNRFQSANSMLKVLLDADWEPVVIPSPPVDISQIQIEPDLDKLPNYNPHLTRLLTIYSQSSLSNIGTRGLDDFAKATYVETKLDTELKPAILQGKYPLVIITGNAGDGKTAFIQKVEEEVRIDTRTEKFESLTSGNGSHFVLDSQDFYTNFDGSQDEGEVINDEVLRRFFQPFAGDSISQVKDRVHIIAINEGRLIDFLQTHKKDFVYLHKQVINFFERNSLPDKDVLIINLNLRSIVAETRDRYSIFDHMISRLSAPELWNKCENCDIKSRCYAKFNADSINDPNYGPQIIRRLKALFQISHFRQKLHITIRDLRSSLAYILFGTEDCNGIHKMLDNPERRQEYIAKFYYNSAFCFGKPQQYSNDRLVQLINEVDPGRVSNPKLDARLAFVHPDEISVFPPFDSRSDYDRHLLSAEYDYIANKLVDISNKNSVANQMVERTQLSHFYHATLRRKVFFERIDEEWITMLPYNKFSKFLSLVELNNANELEEVRDKIVHAISLSEGIYNPEIGSDYLCLRTSQEPKVTLKSFRRFERDQFEIIAREIGELDRYIEYIPSVLILNNNEDESVFMEINLDLYEMLHRIRYGFSPSLNELRGSYINLVIFKRQLSSTRYDEILLTEDEQEFYRVRRIDDEKLELTNIG